MFHFKVSLLVVGLLCSSNIALASISTSINQQSLNQQNLNVNSVNQQKLAHQATEWGLTVEEWNRYTELMAGERGMWSLNLDPLTALGIEAKTEAEKIKYARMLAERFRARVLKEIEFDKIYRQEYEKMYPEETAFTVEPHISQSVGRVIYFTRLDNCNSCKADLGKILNHVNNQTPIDIFIVGDNVTDEAIRKWAKENHIDASKVQRKLITLNHDNGYWFKYSFGKMPAAYQVKGDGQWQALTY
ncbi:TIGR03759 family integrating conjugative element protein [Pasteurella multocida]|uniref:TIGR03759 family integrating conjugative element protein n=1 Tax=Pasteurella multocida TaxID=747 RepID=UPI001C3E5235|nr:TIGR03759 family integrating conjugative element protein [Pasteurella multocida]QXG51784.1 TIGR03759 family integrating conjugative element protein [Pasteurella multocida]WGE13670.1 TIGR03759 family integrating conjugative element protein [Pasteurella multocida]HDX1015704.1 TIGR03759 family integrating conjugative element protein [Pasteurella multocida]HDX1025338.1 TIGR03759 family integrating conjugative element protein [Pasteurella multocida]HDX1030038.1 TIGR03759 family integrating conju